MCTDCGEQTPPSAVIFRKQKRHRLPSKCQRGEIAGARVWTNVWRTRAVALSRPVDAAPGTVMVGIARVELGPPVVEDRSKKGVKAVLSEFARGGGDLFETDPVFGIFLSRSLTAFGGVVVPFGEPIPTRSHCWILS
jgi:hypothetical protein